MKGSQKVSQSEWQSQRAYQSIKFYEFDSYIVTHPNELARKTIVEPEGETKKNKLTIYVRTSSGKTISIKCDTKGKAMSIVDEVERRSAIPRSMTHLVHLGKVLNEKRIIEENNIGTEKRWKSFYKNLGFSRSIITRDELIHCENERRR